jgi:glycosyltransferase involved in cell wall biosynthesis
MVSPALAYKKRYDKPVFLYCLDIWPESALAHIHNKKSLLYKIITLYSKSVYQSCDCIAVTSKPFIEYFNNFLGIKNVNLVYIPQHADGRFLEIDLTTEYDGIVDFMFAGNLGRGQKLETIINAVQQLRDRRDFLVHFVGDGSMRASLEQMVKDSDICDKVIFHGQKKYEEMPKLYNKADALLITLRGNSYVGNTMPGKLQTYMAIGKPIFGAINGAAKQVIEEAQCGACVQAEDSIGLASIMADYIDHPEVYQQCGLNSRKYFLQHFSFPVFMDRLEHELKGLLPNGIS